MNQPRVQTKACGRGLGTGFTLIELLVVIALIGLLAGLLFPAARRAINNAKIGRASAEARHLAQAFEAYRNDLMYWPVIAFSNRYNTAQLGGTNDIAIDDRVMKRMAYLEYAPGDMILNTQWSRNRAQPIKVQTRAYLALDTNQMAVCSDPQLGSVLCLVDPWGNAWQVRFDMDDDGWVLNPFGGSNLTASVIVWSAGPNKTHDQGGANSAANRDNPRSWQ